MQTGCMIEGEEDRSTSEVGGGVARDPDVTAGSGDREAETFDELLRISRLSSNVRLERFRTMAPLVTILIFAVIGFLIHDIMGLVVGAAVGWILSMLIGIFATAWSSGFLPRKVRKETARVF